MTHYRCTVCGYTYTEESGDAASGVPPNTLFSSLPEKWVCPICGASKPMFQEIAEKKPSAAVKQEKKTDLAVLEKSAVCSNLARGCEKQSKGAEAKLFHELADSLKSQMASPENPSFSQLSVMVDANLADILTAKKTARSHADRGALRALVWNEKVSLIHRSLLERYAEEGEAMFAKTSIYVCPICGFISVGDAAPKKCPVCSVPEWMFEAMEES